VSFEIVNSVSVFPFTVSYDKLMYLPSRITSGEEEVDHRHPKKLTTNGTSKMKGVSLLELSIVEM